MATLNALVIRARRHILETLALLTPVSPLVGQVGTPGAASVTYKIVALNPTGHSDASQGGVTATANAVLNGTNFNRINWVRVPRATGYQVYRPAGGPSQGLIATLGDVATLDDTGLAGDGSIAPTINTSGTVGSSQFWSDDELVEYAINGCRDLWRAVIDLHQEHYATFLEDGTFKVANGLDQLQGVPTDVFRILLIEPLDTTDLGAFNYLKFRPSLYNSREFRRMRTVGALDPTQGGLVLYDISQPGSPVGAPQIRIAPKVSADVPLRLQYVPTLPATLGGGDLNPIPGESDQAVVAWIVAYALSRQREDLSPDPNWLAVYSTEKTSILVVSAPRQEQEPIVRPGIFDDLYEDF